jgi:hypothetical protein
MLYLAAYLRRATATPRTPLLLRALFATATVVDARHSALTGAEPGTVLVRPPQDVQAAIDVVGAARDAVVAGVGAPGAA